MRSFASAVALGALLACSAASPETQVKETLGRTGRVEQAAGGARIELPHVRFGDVYVSLDGGRALVVSTVEADGRVRRPSGDVALSYVGREALTMARCASAGWCPSGDPLPALGGVVSALLAAPRPERLVPSAWQIRVERERATVGEDAELDGRRVRERYEVVRGGDGAWRVVAAR